MKIMTIGGATKDTVIQYENQEMLHLNTTHGQQSFLIFEDGKKIEVTSLGNYTGGGATNSAVSFKRLGFDVNIICKVGSNHHANLVFEKLKKEGVDTTLIQQSKKTPTGHSFILPSAQGDRCIFAFRGANTELLQKEIPEDEIKKTDWLYITSLSGKSSQLLLPITEFAKKQNIPVANNPGISQLAAGAQTLCKALKNIEILILNAQEANEFMQSLVQTDEALKAKISHSRETSEKQQAPRLVSSPIHYRDIQFNIRDFFEEVLSRGPKIVVVTNGAEGVYVASEKNIYFHPSLPPQKIANTLGAGDAFGSCFVAQIAQGKTASEALKMGIVNAASVISHLDAKTGLLSAQELEKRVGSATQNLELKFEL